VSKGREEKFRPKSRKRRRPGPRRPPPDRKTHRPRWTQDRERQPPRGKARRGNGSTEGRGAGPRSPSTEGPRQETARPANPSPDEGRGRPCEPSTGDVFSIPRAADDFLYFSKGGPNADGPSPEAVEKGIAQASKKKEGKAPSAALLGRR